MAETTDAMVDDLIESLHLDYPNHRPNLRPAHTSGIGAVGWFRGTHAAPAYCRAPHFGREWTPVRIRFSNANGQLDPDGQRQIRGMAMKFYINGKLDCDDIVPRDEKVPIIENDLICISLPMLPVATPEKAVEFFTALQARKVRRPSLLKRLMAQLTLCPLPAQEEGVSMAGIDGAIDWSRKNPEGQAFLLANSMLRPPSSYARTGYHAVHAFKLTGNDGTVHMARFTMGPADGMRTLGPAGDERNEFGSRLPHDYLHEELRARLGRVPSRFSMRIQVADPWDDTSDPAAAWPRTRPYVLMGSLAITKVVDDQAKNCEQLSFNPGRLVDGIDLSDDKILHARIPTYEKSQSRRGADHCPVMHGGTD
jgi:catalase